MAKKSLDPPTDLIAILAIVIAGIVQISGASGPFTLWNVMSGVILLSILLVYGIPDIITRNKRAMFATCATWGFTLTLTLGILLQGFYRHVLHYLNPQLFKFLPKTDREAPDWYYFIAWLILSYVSYRVIRSQSRRSNKST